MDYADYMIIESATAPESVEPMVKSVEDILMQLKNETVSDQQLSEAKSYLIGALPLRFSSTLSLSGAAIRMQLDGRPITALDDYADHINDVSVEDVQRVARRVFQSTVPTVKIVTGAVPDHTDYDMVDTVPGIE
jgi:zinc protease